MTEEERKLPYRSRLLALVVVVTVLGAPAVVLRALCVGHSCDEEADALSEVPFCSLPEDLRKPLSNGFRKGRSPEVLAVTGETFVADSSVGESSSSFVWPSTQSEGSERIPIAFSGPGIAATDIPAGTGLDDIAPTLAESIDLNRRFPEVRSGTAVSGVAPDSSPVLLVVVALKGMGSEELKASNTPTLDRMLVDGAGTTDGSVLSLPLDPAAALTTIGTGGLPSQHGIVGELVRNDEGKLVSAWAKGSPVSVIAGLGDDLDEALDQEPLIGLAGSEPEDRGLIGGNWYVNVDRDVVSLSKNPGRDAPTILKRGFGSDDVPDLLGVALEGDPDTMDRDLAAIVEAVDRTSGGRYVIAVAGTGSLAVTKQTSLPADEVVRRIDADIPETTNIIEAAGASGLYLDQPALIETELTEDAAIDALQGLRAGGEPVVVDSFASVAVSFAKYC
jgi:hypothetical protein